ncbi:MAG: hypothetical protein QNJ11_11330 [Woeseiaceae bacterium]|nr:hypothetical protein [Woeseiaceae bacterium]
MTPFQMGIVVDEAHGRSIQTGNYEKAIARLTQRSPSKLRTFSSQNNLCVAYVKTAELGKAAETCQAAVDDMKKLEARASKKSRRSLKHRAYRSDLAVALSNRGVLFAVSGETARARADFQAAMELGSRYARFAADNLNKLDAVPDSGE